ncbi:hypothetical protein D3C83_310570 [compost metagenome]
MGCDVERDAAVSSGTKQAPDKFRKAGRLVGLAHETVDFDGGIEDDFYAGSATDKDSF